VRLIPRDEGFFDLFDRLAACVVRAGGLLHELFHEPNRLDDLVVRIKGVEHDADELTHEIMLRIDRSFVTPLDREDIYLLATRLDTVCDLIDGTARRARMFHLTDRREPAKQLSALLERSTTHLRDAVKGIKDPKLVFQRTRDVKQVEEEGDAVYAEAVGALFHGTPDPLTVIKWKELYDNLEHALDECEDVMNVLESISLKHS
jgi:hypothetical protein